MAEKILNTRIQLKYDTYAAWTTNDPILKKGEVAIATIATGSTETVNSVTLPQVLIKVGDGSKHYSELPFASALAADVYSWAKASTKPSYSASEITGLTEYIGGVDTDTQYQLVKDDAKSNANQNVYKLQSKSKNGTFSDITGLPDITVKTDAGINSLIDAAINTLNLANTYDAKGSAKAVQDDLDTYKSTNDAAVAAIKSTADAAATKTYVDAELGKKQDNLVFNTAYNSTTNKAATMKDVEDATSGLTGAMHFIGTVSSDPTGEGFDKSGYKAGDVVLYGAKEYVFSKDNNFVLLGDEGSYALKTTSITAADGLTGGGTLENSMTISLSESTKTSLGLANTALQAADKTELEGSITGINDHISTQIVPKINALEDKAHVHSNKTVLDGITDSDIELWNAAESNANAYTDSSIGGLASIATTGNVNDLVQTTGDVLVFDCGNATI